MEGVGVIIGLIITLEGTILTNMAKEDTILTNTEKIKDLEVIIDLSPKEMVIIDLSLQEILIPTEVVILKIHMKDPLMEKMTGRENFLKNR